MIKLNFEDICIESFWIQNFTLYEFVDQDLIISIKDFGIFMRSSVWIRNNTAEEEFFSLSIEGLQGKEKRMNTMTFKSYEKQIWWWLRIQTNTVIDLIQRVLLETFIFYWINFFFGHFYLLITNFPHTVKFQIVFLCFLQKFNEFLSVLVFLNCQEKFLGEIMTVMSNAEISFFFIEILQCSILDFD